MKETKHVYSNRLWNDALQNVLLSASAQIAGSADEVGDVLRRIQWLYDPEDNKKPPDASVQEESVLKEATVDLTVQFNQLASVHNMNTINEAAGIIRDIMSA